MAINPPNPSKAALETTLALIVADSYHGVSIHPGPSSLEVAALKKLIDCQERLKANDARIVGLQNLFERRSERTLELQAANQKLHEEIGRLNWKNLKLIGWLFVTGALSGVGVVTVGMKVWEWIF